MAAADHGLQGLHEGRAGDEGVASLLRHGGMGAVPAQQDVELVGAGHHRPRVHGELAGGQARPVVHAVDGFHREAREQALLDHHPGAAVGLLGGLEDEHHRALEIAMRGKVFRRSQQHRGMPVVAAGVHAAFMPRTMREQVLLVHRQRVHVGAQGDCPVSLAAPQHSDHAGAGEAAMRFYTARREEIRDLAGGAMLVESQFRMRVQIVAQRHQLLACGLDARQRGHATPGTACLVTATATM